MVIWFTEKLHTMYIGIVLMVASPLVARWSSRQRKARPTHKHEEKKNNNRLTGQAAQGIHGLDSLGMRPVASQLLKGQTPEGIQG